VSDDDLLELDFEVQAPAERAFRVWTQRAGLWWPKAHTIGGDPESIVFEGGVGGRILERGRDGVEHEWGEITAWDEPNELAFRWVHVFDPAQATNVTLSFLSDGATTRIRLRQNGFAALGEPGQERRARTRGGWSTVLAAFARAAEPDDVAT
jgi:uncharacterized protein YndB with AHSA1/START domain